MSLCLDLLVNSALCSVRACPTCTSDLVTPAWHASPGYNNTYNCGGEAGAVAVYKVPGSARYITWFQDFVTPVTIGLQVDLRKGPTLASANVALEQDGPHAEIISTEVSMSTTIGSLSENDPASTTTGSTYADSATESNSAPNSNFYVSSHEKILVFEVWHSSYE